MSLSLKPSADGLSAEIQIGGVTKATIDSTGKITATSFAGSGAALTGITTLPTQTGNSGKRLTTDGTNASWSAITSTEVTTALGFTPPSTLLLATDSIGSYCFAHRWTSVYPAYGETISGNYLRPSAIRQTTDDLSQNIGYAGSGSLSGTWKCLGDCAGGTWVITLFQRVA